MAFSTYAPDKLPELTSTLIGTLLGAVLAAAVGVGLSYYQGRKTEATRVQYLLESLIGELYATRDRLGATSPMRVPDPEGNSEFPRISLVGNLVNRGNLTSAL
ncbi:MAG: hypothetical protein QOI57_3411 [Rubrobacteraceae bacterium]|jgi:hypothetical protein|nr:hypothetical protein [Rubrobacteraceae bacterium]